jgi:hypothetical protein
LRSATDDGDPQAPAGGRARPRAPERERAEALGERPTVEPKVPGKHLVAAVAVERDRHARARQLRQQVRRHGRRVAERAVVVIDEPIDEVERLRLDHELRVLGAERVGDDLRVLALVVLAVVRESRS